MGSVFGYEAYEERNGLMKKLERKESKIFCRALRHNFTRTQQYLFLKFAKKTPKKMNKIVSFELEHSRF